MQSETPAYFAAEVAVGKIGSLQIASLEGSCCWKNQLKTQWIRERSHRRCFRRTGQTLGFLP